jgi:hypothetical protein
VLLVKSATRIFTWGKTFSDATKLSAIYKNSDDAMIMDRATSPKCKWSTTRMLTVSHNVRTVLNFLVRSIRCAPMTMASYAAPKLLTMYVKARRVMEVAAAERNSGGTPAAWARWLEKKANGIKPKTDRPSMVMLPVLSNLLALSKLPVPVASPTYLMNADFTPAVPNRIYPASVKIIAQIPYPPSPRWAITNGTVTKRLAI